ncbi:unnamed protein product [Urochloa decumbens]|uniref:F-box domain-containing protein n=1 Tax=Urochloa decumbens TaxID=240449 RepID=A0ABC9GC31_9POAL
MAMATLLTELVEEILLRLPPSEPACLFRAALVCKRWCGIVSAAGFHRRYGEFHGAPPTIAAVYNVDGGDAYVACFRPCASFPPRADRHGKAVVDCRHGRVLLRPMPPIGEDLNHLPMKPVILDVWDPATDEQWKLCLPYLYPNSFYGVVLCAGAGTCNHLGCHGGPFLVVIAGTDLKDIFVYTYSSEAAAWSKPSTIHLDTALNSSSMFSPGLVAGDSIYFMLEEGYRIVKYDLGGCVISMIDPPLSLHDAKGKVYLVETKDGGLGIANVDGYNLHVWYWRLRPGSNGMGQWVEEQVIKLDTVLPVATNGPSTEFDVVGFGEGTDVILGSANAGMFVVWQSSGRVMKADERRAVPFPSLEPMFCYQNFYTPALGAFLKGEGPKVVSSA